MKKVLIPPSIIFIIISTLLWFLFHKYGDITKWSDIGNLSTAIAALLVFLSIYFLVINWLSIRTQNEQLKSQSEDLKRSTDAQVFRTLIDILQAEDIRHARKYVYENFGDKDSKPWNDEDKVQAEKVCHTFDVAATMVTHKLLPEALLNNWGDTIMKSWAYVNKLVKEYRRERGQPHLWDDFEKFAIKYAMEQKQCLIEIPSKNRDETIIKRAQEVANYFARMGKSNEAQEIKGNYGI